MSAISNTNQRVLRSASKARTDDGGAPPSITAPRSTRTRGSRRGASPAITDTTEAKKPEVTRATNRAYGTTGKPSDLELQSAQLGMEQAVNPILQAVSGAEASQEQFTNYRSNLPIVDEEADSSAPNSRPFVHKPGAGDLNSVAGFDSRASVRDSHAGDLDPMAGPGPYSRNHWAPRPALDPHIEAQIDVILADEANRGLPTPTVVERAADKILVNHMYDVLVRRWTNYFLSTLYIVLSVATTVFTLWALFKYGFGTWTPFNNSPANVTTHQHRDVVRRLHNTEQQVQDLVHRLQSINAIPQREVNWFTPGFGATIDHKLSSPTATFCDPEWRPFPLSLLKSKCPELPFSEGHLMAIKPWHDPIADQWCSPRSGGKLQLTIGLERTIIPTDLIMEHYTKDVSPVGFMGTAPKEVELFIRVEDDELRSKLRDAISRDDPLLLEESSSQGKELHLATEIDEDFIRVGRYFFNIHQNRERQVFSFPSILQEYGVDTTRVAVRVNSNWGNQDFTCINRLRMHGMDTSGKWESLDEESTIPK